MEWWCEHPPFPLRTACPPLGGGLLRDLWRRPVQPNAVLPSEIRQRVLEQHKTIRDRVESIEDLACSVAAAGADYGELIRGLESLLSVLRTHMRFEDQVLSDALREADAWGEERVERFYADHTQQRKMIQNLVDVVAQRGDLERALLALGFCALLRRDMEGEEQVFLSDQVLRDDPVTIQPEPE